MDETATRERIAEHFALAGKDEIAAAEIFTDDAVLEWPQSGERIRGKPQIIALHEASPVKVDFGAWSRFCRNGNGQLLWRGRRLCNHTVRCRWSR